MLSTLSIRVWRQFANSVHARSLPTGRWRRPFCRELCPAWESSSAATRHSRRMDQNADQPRRL